MRSEANQLIQHTVVESGSPSINWGGTDLPHFAFDVEVVRVLNQKEPGSCEGYYNTEMCAVPAWRYALFAVVLEWTMWLVTPYIGNVAATCGEGGSLASVPDWVVLAIVVPVIPASLFLEWICSKYVVPPMLATLGAYKVCGFIVPFPAYTIATFAVSCLSRLDLYTSGIVFAKLFKTGSCPGSRLQEFWDAVLAHSFASWLPDLTTLACVIWGLLFLQLVHALCQSIPIQAPGHNWFTFKGLLNQTVVNNTYFNTNVRTLSGDTGIFQATMALAEASRMSALLFRNNSFFVTLVSRFLDRSWIRTNWTVQTMKLAGRVCVFLLLESSLMVNFQSTLLGMEKAISGKLDLMTVVSVCISLLMGFYNLALGVVSMWRMIVGIWPHWGETNTIGHPTPSTADPEHEDMISKRKLFATVAVWAVAVGASVACLVYALVKTYMIIFQCDRGAWNMSGCVETLPGPRA